MILKKLIETYIENSNIDFCTDESAYGFVLGLTMRGGKKIIIKLNLNYYTPYGKYNEATIRKFTKKRENKKNQNIDDFKREVSNQLEFTKFSSAIPKIVTHTVLQREDAIAFSNALGKLNGNCKELPGWTAHLISQLKELEETQKHKYETKTGVIVMESVGDLTLDDIVDGKYSAMQKAALEKHTTTGDTIKDTFIGKGRALLLSLLWMGILHGDPHKENIRVDSTTGKLYLIDYGASIDFGSGYKHLPKYLQTDQDTQNTFTEIKENVEEWLSLKEPYNENGFMKQYIKQSKDKTIDNNQLDTLLEHTIIKADPRQNGDLLTWSDMQQSRWELYRGGYEWIVDIDDSSEKWKDMIHNGFHSNRGIRHSSSSSNQTRRHRKKPPTSSSSRRRREEEKFGEFPLHVDLDVNHRRFTRKNKKDILDKLNNYTRQSLMSIKGFHFTKKDTKKDIMNKIMEGIQEDPSISSKVEGSLSRLSYSRQSSRNSTRKSSRNSSRKSSRNSSRVAGIEP
tara:strand:- start:30 stop:1559 length:1530 start_codon:yes stop_codon:yes gene_type:complete